MSKTEVATVDNARDALAQATTYEDLFTYARSQGLAIESSEQYGDGVDVVDKETLLNTPLVLVSWKFNVGDLGEYVTARGMTQNGVKFVFSDGGVGIYQQLWRVTEKRLEAGLYDDAAHEFLAVPQGLRKSSYKKDGVPAVTYYLAD